MPITPDDSVSVSVGKILLKLSANFSVSETAINFLTKNLLDTVMHCVPCSKMKLLNRYRNCPLHLKETSFSRNILIMSHQKKFILAAKKKNLKS
jgi:hypothetical protein